MNNETSEKLYWIQQQLNGAVVFIVLTVLVVALNLLALRLRKNQRAIHSTWNSLLAIPSLVVFVTLCGAVISKFLNHCISRSRLYADFDYSVNAQAYKSFYKTHRKTDQASFTIIVTKSAYAISVIYPVACTLPKLLLCILYLQIFSSHTWTRRASYSMIGFISINCIAWLVPTIVVCYPISAFWSLHGRQGRCLNYNVFGTWISVPNIVSDLIMLVLPIPILWKMNLDRTKKLGIILTFAVGCTGILGACIRYESTPFLRTIVI